MSANTPSTLAPSAFALAGPATTTTAPPSESHSRRNDLHMRIHQAHVRANIRRLQALGRGLPSPMRHTQRTRTTRAVAHTVPPSTTATTTTTTTTTTIITTTNLTIRAPQPRRPLSAIILNGLPTPPESPSPAPFPVPAPAQPQNQTQTQTEMEACLRLPTRRSRTRAARTGIHGTGAGLSFELDVFGDDPVLSPRAAADGGRVRRTPGAPARTFAGYFPPTRAGEDEENVNVFHVI